MGLLAAFLVWSDAERVGQCLGLVGWAAPLVLVPEALVLVLDTRGWQILLSPASRHRVPFRALYLTRMAGEAMNGLTPAATVGGEPVKALLLRRFGVGGSDAMASIVLARTALVTAQAVFVAIGLTAFVGRSAGPVWAVVWAIPQLVAVSVFVVLLVRLQKQGLAGGLWRFASRLAPRARWVARLEHGAAALDRRLDDFHRLEQTTFARATAWHLAGWTIGTLEVWFLLRLIEAPVGMGTAFLIESLGQVVRAAALVIPGALGVQEWGGTWVTTALGVATPEAAALWLLKRGREVVFDLAGLAYLGRNAVRRE